MKSEIDRIDELARMLFQAGLTIAAASAAGLTVAGIPTRFDIPLGIALAGGGAATIFSGFALWIQGAPATTNHAAFSQKLWRARFALATAVLGVLIAAGWAAVAGIRG